MRDFLYLTIGGFYYAICFILFCLSIGIPLGVLVTL